MQDNERQQLKDRIRQEITKLTGDIASLEEATRPVGALDGSVGRLSMMDTIVNKGVNETALHSSRQRLNKLRTMLERIDDDPEFGLCEDCGDPIPLKRLLFVPESGLCVECAS